MPAHLSSSGPRNEKLREPRRRIPMVRVGSSGSWLAHPPLDHAFFVRFGPRLVEEVMVFMASVLASPSAEPSNHMEISRLGSGGGNGLTGLHLFWYCHCLAQSTMKLMPGTPQPLLPSGGRIFYYTRRLLLARGIVPAVFPDREMLSHAVAERFLREAPLIAERLRTDFFRAVQLRAEPVLQLRQILSHGPLMKMPELAWAPGHLAEVGQDVVRIWERLWEACWREAAQEHLARLLVLIRPDRLSVAPITRSDDQPVVALRLLRDRVIEDAKQGQREVSADAYLYDQSLEQWLARSLLS